MAKFCGKCGAKLDDTTGLCPNCDADKLKEQSDKSEAVDVAKSTQETAPTSEEPLSKKEAKKKRKADKKAKKKEKRAQWSAGKKARRFFLRLLLWLTLLATIVGSLLGILVYCGMANITVIETLLNDIGIVSYSEFSGQTVNGCYVPKEENIVYQNEDKSLGYVNNIILVFFNHDTSEENINKVVQSVNGTVVGRIDGINQYQIQVESMDREDLDSLCDTLTQNEYVKYAIVDTVVTMDDNEIPNDPWKDTFQGVWGVDWDENKPDGYNWWIEAVKVPSAWKYNDELSTVNVGVVDNGFDISHEDLNITVLNDDVNNAENHGTHVSGIIGATINNEKGISGILNKKNLYCVDCYATSKQKKSNITVSSLMDGIIACLDSQCKVVNMSSGVKFTSKDGTADSAKETARVATIYLYAMLDSYKDFIIVQSAGNGNKLGVGVDAHKYAGYFASIDADIIQSVAKEFKKKDVVLDHNITAEDIQNSYMIVGAMDVKQKKGNWQLSEFSNYGDSVTVCAPGVDVFSTIVSGGFDGSYGNMDGTSMAAPIVTGITAMVWSVDQTMSSKQVQDYISTTANEIVLSRNKNDSGTYHLINASAALESALNDFTNEEASNSKGQFEQSDVHPDAVKFNGHYYYVYNLDTVTTWEEAKEYCELQGGYLATITSPEEDTFLYDYITDAGYNSVMFGLTDQERTDDWRWVTGEKLSYQNWRSGEPNHQGGYEHYGMYYKKNTDGTWNDGSGKGGPFICEWGEYQVDPDSQPQEPIRTTSDERDIVLVLDTSGSMSGTPMEETKKAATKFVNTILEEDASIGIVTYEDSANRLSDFSIDKEYLTGKVANISDGGGTNIESGLAEAKSMLDSSNAKKKIIVLMSDGEPNEGKEGEDLIAYADDIKSDDILIYTLGFFENMSGSKSSAQYLMEQLASDGCHYEVASADDLVFFFEDMADQINGQKYIYVRIACPVDVSVTYNGETLSSAESALNVRTDFGTLTFEDNENVTSDNEDDRIKVLRLKEGAGYDVQIVGTGRGMMDYTIGFMDEIGDYNDFRRFEDVKITKRTVIDTVAVVSDESVLNIDENGDGKYDVKLRAEENGYGEEVKTPVWIYVGIAGGAVLLVIIVLAVVKVRKNKKKD